MDDVLATEIESKVGIARHPTEHLLRLRSDEQRWYLLHSAECRATTNGSLQGCTYSLAMSRTDVTDWPEDTVLVVYHQDDEDRLWCEFEPYEPEPLPRFCSYPGCTEPDNQTVLSECLFDATAAKHTMVSVSETGQVHLHGLYIAPLARQHRLQRRQRWERIALYVLATTTAVLGAAVRRRG